MFIRQSSWSFSTALLYRSTGPECGRLRPQERYLRGRASVFESTLTFGVGQGRISVSTIQRVLDFLAFGGW